MLRLCGHRDRQERGWTGSEERDEDGACKSQTTGTVGATEVLLVVTASDVSAVGTRLQEVSFLDQPRC